MQLPRLHFPEYSFRIQSSPGGGQSSKIFDIIRKKYVSLTPEEWVRQNLIHYLVFDRQFPISLLGVEKKLLVNNLFRRTDLVAYNNSLQPVLLAECKSPSVQLSQTAFDQAARYNITLAVKFFILTNGYESYCCIVDREKQAYQFLTGIPPYSEVSIVARA